MEHRLEIALQGNREVVSPWRPSSTHTRQVGRLTRLPGPGSGLQAEEQDS